MSFAEDGKGYLQAVSGPAVKKGVEQGKTDPLAERTSEVKAKLEAAGIKSKDAKLSSSDRQVTLPKVGGQAIGDRVMRLAERRASHYMDKYNAGMDALGITEDQVLLHQKSLRQDEGKEFTDQERKELVQSLVQAAFNPDSAAAKEFAQQVKDSHSRISSRGTRTQSSATAGPETAEFYFPIPRSIKGMQNADQYPRIMAQMFPEPDRATPWRLLRAEEKLVAHIKAGSDPKDFDFNAPIAKSGVSTKPARTQSSAEKEMIRNVFIKDMEMEMGTVRERVSEKNVEREQQRTQRDVEFRQKIAQHNYEASVRALERRGVEVSDDIKQAIKERVGYLPDQQVTSVDNTKSQLSTGDTSRGVKKGVEQGKTDPLAERTSEVKAKLEAAGIKFDEQQQGVTVDVSGLSAAANPKQQQNVSEQVAGPGFLQQVLQLIQEAFKAVVKLLGTYLPDQQVTSVDNTKSQLSTGDTSRGVKKGVEQGKTDPLAERTSEVKAKLEAAGIKFDEQQQGVTVDVSGLSAAANPKQQQNVSEQVMREPALESAVKEFADVVAATRKPDVSAAQQPAAQQSQSIRSR